MKKIVTLVALLYSSVAFAQVNPTPVYGLQIKTNNPGLSPAGSIVLRFDGASLLQSVNGAAYTAVGGVTSVTNSDSTLTISPTTGAVIGSLNLSHANTWLAVQTFNVGFLKINNAANTFATLFATNATAARTITFQDVTDTAAVLGTAQTYTKSQNVTAVAVTDGASIATDSSLGNTFTVTLGGNRTLANPTNLVSGGQYMWIVTQGGGSNTLAYGNLFKFSGGIAPVLTTAASSVDMVSCVYNGTILGCVFTPDLR